MSAYRAAPGDARRGGLVLLGGTEGPDEALRAVADSFAFDGYEVLAPDIVAELSPGAGADPANLDVFSRTGWGEVCLPAVQQAIDGLEGPVYVLGFGFGGTVAWLAAARCRGIAAASVFYGGHVIRWIDEGLRCPVILHFGKQDPLVPPDDVERIREARPDLPVFVYEAGHGFAQSGAPADADAAQLAMLRTRQLFVRSGGRGESGS